MPRPNRVRSVRYRTLGSATRLRDEMQVPGLLYHGGRGVMAAARHWRISGPLVFFAVIWSGAGQIGRAHV